MVNMDIEFPKRRLFLSDGNNYFHLMSFTQSRADSSIYVSSPDFSKIKWLNMAQERHAETCLSRASLRSCGINIRILTSAFDAVYTIFMKTTIDTIIAEVLSLSPQARAFVAEKLIESLDSEPEAALSSTWREEVRKRCREINEGLVELRDAEDVFAR